MAKSRSNVGIEALRVLAMLMIVSLHYLGHGGVIHSPGSINYEVGWLLESFSYVAVNCYVLISGYLLINSTFKLKRVFDLWLQIFFYSVVIGLLFIYAGESVPTLQSLFTPITSKVYWFATAYMGLYLFSPYINKMIKALGRKEFNKLIVIILLSLGVMSFNSIDTFQVEGGYSLIWLIALYILGAYIRINEIKFNVLIMFTLYAALSVLTYYTKVWNIDNFYNYNSPTVILASIALFLCFKDLKLDMPIVSHFFRFFGPLTFGVYLIHEHPLMREALWKYLNVSNYYNSTDFLINYAASILIIFLVCALIEAARKDIFDMFSRRKGDLISEKQSTVELQMSCLTMTK